MKSVIVQSPIVEFDFRVTDLFVDLQDGLRLCRAIQLLQDDSSILMVVILFLYFLNDMRVQLIFSQVFYII